MKTKTRLIPLLLVLVFALTACINAGPPPSDEAVPSGDPPFPSFTGSWVIDTTGQVPAETIQQTNAILEKLRSDGIAETAIVVVNGVSHPELYATRLGRHLKLGSTETDNGLVYLVQPDAPDDQHVIYSVGRGLTAFTSGRVTDAVSVASKLANSGDFPGAVLSIAQGTDTILRQQYNERPETVTNDGESEEDQLTPEQQKVLVKTALWIIGVWTVIGLGLMVIDVELGLQWILLGFRILLLVATAGKAGGGTGGSGNFGGRSGSR